jgi:hypothetical protein
LIDFSTPTNALASLILLAIGVAVALAIFVAAVWGLMEVFAHRAAQMGLRWLGVACAAFYTYLMLPVVLGQVTVAAAVFGVILLAPMWFGVAVFLRRLWRGYYKEGKQATSR